MKQLSVIVITNNSEKNIDLTLSSIVCQQEVDDIECVVVDQGSLDDTLKIVESYKDRVNLKIIKYKSDKFSLMNKAIREASGVYISLLDSGSCFASQSSVYDALSYFDKDKCHAVYIGTEAIDSKIFAECRLNYQDFMVKREVYLKYPFNTSYAQAAYYDFLLKCFSIKEFKFINIYSNLISPSILNAEEQFKFEIESLMILSKYAKDDCIRRNNYYINLAKEETVRQKSRIRELISLNRERNNELKAIKLTSEYKLGLFLFNFLKVFGIRVSRQKGR
ncbi:glycosyltransferase [Francisella philomiragia]|uniref:glycosyltransferase n=1 Tax=Francisella philomiragia TaxID=28110 RepID=UPI0018AFEACB|nr:glycosyltransferase [Francisella philomiragia]MBK2255590.1 glycosyltransferase [Francisella philomiragia]MBK2273918.1 glycosyltransferase [Francisella philomiragia]MBK2277745.1 glycosyltransferase [Francisella philomiragia]MBK2281663.1 glycosyltransferase [Francisella philomiragia]MBK2283656.1 glycosyltransferase [Francisella philomiragia]